MQSVLLCTSSEVAGFGLVGNRYWYQAVTKVRQKFCLLDSFTTTHWYVTGRICFNGKKVRDVSICDRRIAGSVFLLGSFVKLTLKLVLSRLVKARPVNTLGTQWLGQQPNHIRDIVIYGICCEMSSTTEWLGIRKHRKVLIRGAILSDLVTEIRCQNLQHAHRRTKQSGYGKKLLLCNLQLQALNVF